MSNITTNDPEYAELQRKRAKIMHWKSKDSVKRPYGEDMKVLESTMVGSVEVEDEDDVRYGETLRVPLYKVGDLGRLLGKSSTSIRKYEDDGVIPPSFINLVGKNGREKRGYTYDQMMVVYDLLPLFGFSDARGMKYTLFSRELWKRWAELPNGIKPQRKEEVPRRGRKRKGVA